MEIYFPKEISAETVQGFFHLKRYHLCFQQYDLQRVPANLTSIVSIDSATGRIIVSKITDAYLVNDLQGKTVHEMAIVVLGSDGFIAEKKLILEFVACELNQTISMHYSKNHPYLFTLPTSKVPNKFFCRNLTEIFSADMTNLCPLHQFNITRVYNPNNTEDKISENYTKFIYVGDKRGTYLQDNYNMICINDTSKAIDFVYI